MPDERPVGEFDLIRAIARRTSSNPRIEIGIGDDCASIRFTAGAEVLVTTDMLMEGRHFLLESAPIEEIGHKCLAVNLSDIAAMAGRPVAAVVAVALPRSRTFETAMGLQAGMERLAAEFGVAIVGGDTNVWDGPLVVSITLMGEPTGRGPVRRSGAKPGDAIFVTGALGGSGVSGRHLRPRPRIIEAQTLHLAVDLHAMIDLSDGLAGDLRHILAESGNLGATLDARAIPIHDDVPRHLDPIASALSDGEDFELCFTVGSDDAAKLVVSPPPGVQLHRIGNIETEPGLRIREANGRVVPCSARGFDHGNAPNSRAGHA
jgi:thiamine-monophosphate kinase